MGTATDRLRILRKSRFSVILPGITAALLLIAICVLIGKNRGDSERKVLSAAMTAIDDRDPDQLQGAINLLKEHKDLGYELTLFRGARSLFLGRPDLALAEFARVSPGGSHRILLLTLTGEALYRQGDLSTAESCLQQAVAEAPDTANAHRWLATVYYDLGAMDRALLHLQEVSRIVPDDYRPHHMRGVIYKEFGENASAVKSFETAARLVRLPSERTNVLVALASVRMTSKEFHAAMLALKKCEVTAEVLSMQAECLWNQGDPLAASETLMRAESVGAVPIPGRRLRSRMLIEDGKPKEATEILIHILSSDASDDEAEYLLATAYKLVGDHSNYTLHLERSESLKGLKVELTALSQTAMENPEDSAVREQLATICDKLGMSHMAEIWRTAAVAAEKKSASESVIP